MGSDHVVFPRLLGSVASLVLGLDGCAAPGNAPASGPRRIPLRVGTSRRHSRPRVAARQRRPAKPARCCAMASSSSPITTTRRISRPAPASDRFRPLRATRPSSTRSTVSSSPMTDNTWAELSATSRACPRIRSRWPSSPLISIPAVRSIMTRSDIRCCSRLLRLRALRPAMAAIHWEHDHFLAARVLRALL